MNYVPPYMNYNQKQGNYDGNLENPFKENYYQENMGCPFNEIQVVETINAVIR